MTLADISIYAMTETFKLLTCFVHFPFGIACAQYILHRMMDHILGCCEEVIIIADDIIIHGKDDA